MKQNTKMWIHTFSKDINVKWTSAASVKFQIWFADSDSVPLTATLPHIMPSYNINIKAGTDAGFISKL